MSTTATNKEFVKRIYDALSDQDRDTFTALCADDSLLHSGDKDSGGLDAAN